MAYFVKEAGLKNAVINRVHYELLKKFGEEQKLEFNWRPNWETDHGNDLRTSIMPYGHYDTPRSCGPDFSVCCRLDFIRIREHCISEFGGKFVHPMTGNHLVEMANELSEQVKKKNALYKHDAVFMQLGEDFRYSARGEWMAQEENFQALFDHFEKHPELGVKVGSQ
jgi:hypothetical protein